MNRSGPSAALGRGSDGLRRQRAMQRSCILPPTSLLSASVPPPYPARPSCLRSSLRLPLLSAISPLRNQTTSTEISVSKASLYTPGGPAVIKGLPRNCCRLGRKPPPSPLLRKSSDRGGCIQSSTSLYMHFSCPIRPATKQAVKPLLQSVPLSAEQRELLPLVMQYQQAPPGETLVVRGKRCLPSPPMPSVTTEPARTELHVFLPTERAGEVESGDNESVDEGFMDELDFKVTSLKIHQGGQNYCAS